MTDFMKPNKKYRIRSGSVTGFTKDNTRVIMDVGAEFIFQGYGEESTIPYPNANKYKSYGVTMEGFMTPVYIVLPIIRIYPDHEKDPNDWYDNAPNLMFELVK